MGESRLKQAIQRHSDKKYHERNWFREAADYPELPEDRRSIRGLKIGLGVLMLAGVFSGVKSCMGNLQESLEISGVRDIHFELMRDIPEKGVLGLEADLQGTPWAGAEFEDPSVVLLKDCFADTPEE